MRGGTETRRRSPLAFRTAREADVPLLVDLYRQLIADEWEPGDLSDERLEARVRDRLAEEEYRTLLFHEGDTVVAYALVSVEEDSAYIRHFYVLPAHRRGGTGRRVVETLLRDVIPPTARVTLDVLAANRSGHAFWRAVGFRDYRVRMERLPARDGQTEGVLAS
jgi:GNAT superfamily N-acetyltransferase